MVRSQRTLMTADELSSLPDTGFRYELIEGRLVKMPPAGAQHGAIANILAFLLTTFVRSNDLGTVFSAETGFFLARNPDTVRASDVSFVSRERLPQGPLPPSFLPLAPDLVAEVVSPSERAAQVQVKVQEWLEAGVRLVWVLQPAEQTVTAFTRQEGVRVFSPDEDLIGDPVLPGFRWAVAELFR